jgi:hypothetical protein
MNEQNFDGLVSPPALEASPQNASQETQFERRLDQKPYASKYLPGRDSMSQNYDPERFAKKYQLQKDQSILQPISEDDKSSGAE